MNNTRWEGAEDEGVVSDGENIGKVWRMSREEQGLEGDSQR